MATKEDYKRADWQVGQTKYSDGTVGYHVLRIAHLNDPNDDESGTGKLVAFIPAISLNAAVRLVNALAEDAV